MTHTRKACIWELASPAVNQFPPASWHCQEGSRSIGREWQREFRIQLAGGRLCTRTWACCSSHHLIPWPRMWGSLRIQLSVPSPLWTSLVALGDWNSLIQCWDGSLLGSFCSLSSLSQMFLPHWLPVSFRISASSSIYLFLCCYLSLLTGLFIPIKCAEWQGLSDAASHGELDMLVGNWRWRQPIWPE